MLSNNSLFYAVYPLSPQFVGSKFKGGEFGDLTLTLKALATVNEPNQDLLIAIVADLNEPAKEH
jgi:hypothetical protein